MTEEGQLIFGAIGPDYETSVCEAFEAIRLYLDISIGMYCLFSRNGVSGMFVQEFTGRLWFRSQVFNPRDDDSSLDFLNVSLEVSNRKLLSRPPTSE